VRNSTPVATFANSSRSSPLAQKTVELQQQLTCSGWPRSPPWVTSEGHALVGHTCVTGGVFGGPWTRKNDIEQKV
jgi:hypothetical protein